MSKPLILVTGANGQLGSELQELATQFPAFDFHFADRTSLPLDQPEGLAAAIGELQPDWCINCAAYTAVDKAETEQELASLINGQAVGALAWACYNAGARFIHISTDYVFDGTSPVPYIETDPVNPVNAYGISKLKGEALCLLNNPDAIIIRTAWVYSSFGQNFVKTMMRLMQERSSINVVSDQVGAPTYAADLARAILDIIQSDDWQPGIYHYSNSGRISWFDFAVAIRTLIGSNCAVNPIPSSDYPTPAKRPSFSLLNTQKITSTWGLSIPDWKTSLEVCIAKINRAG